MLLPHRSPQILQAGKPIRSNNAQRCRQMQSKRFLIVCGNMLATKRERRLGIGKQIDKQRLMFFRLQTQDADVTGEVGVALAQIRHKVSIIFVDRLLERRWRDHHQPAAISCEATEQLVTRLAERLDALDAGERLVPAKLHDHDRRLERGQLRLEIAQALDAAIAATAPAIRLRAQRKHRVGLPRQVAELGRLVFETPRQQRLQVPAALGAHRVRAAEEHNDIVPGQFQQRLSGGHAKASGKQADE